MDFNEYRKTIREIQREIDRYERMLIDNRNVRENYSSAKRTCLLDRVPHDSVKYPLDINFRNEDMVRKLEDLWGKLQHYAELNHYDFYRMNPR